MPTTARPEPRPSWSTTRSREQLVRSEFDSYIRTVASSSGTGTVDDLTRLGELRSSGTITEAEFEAIKARLVSGTSATS